MDRAIMAFLSCDLINRISCGGGDIVQYNALTTMLIAQGIPFDVTFNPGTRRDAPSIEITVYITPTTNITYTIDLGPGPNVASNN